MEVKILFPRSQFITACGLSLALPEDKHVIEERSRNSFHSCQTLSFPDVTTTTMEQIVGSVNDGFQQQFGFSLTWA